MRGIIGWLPLVAKNINELIEKYNKNDKLKAVRHVVQGESDPEFILGKDFNRGISQLKKIWFGLRYSYTRTPAAEYNPVCRSTS